MRVLPLPVLFISGFTCLFLFVGSILTIWLGLTVLYNSFGSIFIEKDINYLSGEFVSTSGCNRYKSTNKQKIFFKVDNELESVKISCTNDIKSTFKGMRLEVSYEEFTYLYPFSKNTPIHIVISNGGYKVFERRYPTYTEKNGLVESILGIPISMILVYFGLKLLSLARKLLYVNFGIDLRRRTL